MEYSSTKDLLSAMRKTMLSTETGCIIKTDCPVFRVFPINEVFAYSCIVNSGEEHPYTETHLRNKYIDKLEKTLFFSLRTLHDLLLRYGKEISIDLLHSKRAQCDAAFCNLIICYVYEKVPVELEYIVGLWEYFLSIGVTVPKLFIITAYVDGSMSLLTEKMKTVVEFRNVEPTPKMSMKELDTDLSGFYIFLAGLKIPNDRSTTSIYVIFVAGHMRTEKMMNDLTEDDMILDEKVNILNRGPLVKGMKNFLFAKNILDTKAYDGQVSFIIDFAKTKILKDHYMGENRPDTVLISQDEMRIRSMLLQDIPTKIARYIYHQTDRAIVASSSPRDTENRDFSHDILRYATHNMSLPTIFTTDPDHSMIAKYTKFIIKTGMMLSQTEITTKGQFLAKFNMNPMLSLFIWEWKNLGHPIFPILLFTSIVSCYDGTNIYIRHNDAFTDTSDRGRTIVPVATIRSFRDAYMNTVGADELRNSFIEDIMSKIHDVILASKHIDLDVSDIPSILNKDVIIRISKKLRRTIDTYHQETRSDIPCGPFDVTKAMSIILDIYKKVSNMRLDLHDGNYKNASKKGMVYTIPMRYNEIYQKPKNIYPLIITRKKNSVDVLLFLTEHEYIKKIVEYEL